MIFFRMERILLEATKNLEENGEFHVGQLIDNMTTGFNVSLDKEEMDQLKSRLKNDIINKWIGIYDYIKEKDIIRRKLTKIE